MIELLDLRLSAVAIILSVVSISFGFISAYITGLYFFLHRAPLLLKMAAFVLLTLSLMFVVLIAVGVSPLAGGIVTGEFPIDGSLQDLVQRKVNGRQLVQFVMADVPLVYLIGWILGILLSVSVYVSLFYMTFFYRWKHETDDAAGR